MLLRLGSVLMALVLAGVGCATGLNAGAGGAGGTGTGTGGAPHDAGADTGDASADHQGGCVLAQDCPASTDPCTQPSCINSECKTQPANEAGACDDGNYCTDGDTCQLGVCVGGPMRYCPPPDTCHVGVCDPTTKGCVTMPGNDGAQCKDGNPCNGVGHCSAGTCTGAPPINCSNLNGPCAVGICDPVQGCVAQAKADGMVCPVTPANPCQTGTCMAGVCQPQPVANGAACPVFPPSPCTVGTCQMGTCTPQPANNGTSCPVFPSSPCTVGTCQMGTCAAQPANNGTACSIFPMPPCHTGACMAGTCTPQTVANGTTCFLSMPSPCLAGACQAGACTGSPTNEGGTCDDGLFCTINDHCHLGACTGGGPNVCAPGSSCLIGSCDEAGKKCTSVPGNDGTACTNGDVCNTGPHCQAGVCGGGTPTNNGMTCNSGTSCVMGTTCTAGVCGGGTGPTVYFADDFHDSSKGWALDTEWQIGPAMLSMGQTNGNPDPAMDHSPTSDNGVAGVVIGGNETPVIHPPYYITSPAFDTSTAAGPVILGYYRWLNSDYTPFMTNYVDVWDGTVWKNLWKSGMAPGVQDAMWTYVSFDVTAYKNSGMRVRFGYEIGSVGVYTVSQWNLDDVLVASAACP